MWSEQIKIYIYYLISKYNFNMSEEDKSEGTNTFVTIN